MGIGVIRPKAEPAIHEQFDPPQIMCHAESRVIGRSFVGKRVRTGQWIMNHEMVLGMKDLAKDSRGLPCLDGAMKERRKVRGSEMHSLIGGIA